MTEQPLLLRVAHPRECTTQQSALKSATACATPLQHTSLKAASLRVLERNKPCNTSAIAVEKPLQQTPLKTSAVVADIAIGIQVNGSTDKQAAGATVGTYHGLTLADLKAVAEDDWPDIEHDTVMLETLAHSMVTRRLREQGIVPSHYTQAVHCEGCGPVWLWEGSPDTVQGCPWCFVRMEGLPVPRPPQPVYSPSQTGDLGHTAHGVRVAKDRNHDLESYQAAGMVRCRDCRRFSSQRCGIDHARTHATQWRRCADFREKP